MRGDFLPAGQVDPWIRQVKLPERLDDRRRDHQPRIPLVVRRHHVPRGLPGSRATDGVLVGGHVIIPKLALPDVGRGELPILFRLLEALQETALLLLARDVQEEFEHGGALPRQISLKPGDVVEALPPNPLGYERRRHPLPPEQFRVHTDNEHLLIVRPVEDADAATLRQALLAAPQVVVIKIFQGGLLERVHLAPLRVHPRHDVADGAILAGGVHRLEQQQQGVAVLGVELVLLLGQPLDPLLQQFPGHRLLVGPKASRVARVDVLQAKFLPLGDAIRLDELFDLFQDLPPLLFHGNRSPGR